MGVTAWHSFEASPSYSDESYLGASVPAPSSSDFRSDNPRTATRLCQFQGRPRAQYRALIDFTTYVRRGSNNYGFSLNTTVTSNSHDVQLLPKLDKGFQQTQGFQTASEIGSCCPIFTTSITVDTGTQEEANFIRSRQENKEQQHENITRHQLEFRLVKESQVS